MGRSKPEPKKRVAPIEIPSPRQQFLIEQLGDIRTLTVDERDKAQRAIAFLGAQDMIDDNAELNILLHASINGQMNDYIEHAIKRILTTMWGRTDVHNEIDETEMRWRDPGGFHNMVTAAGHAHADVFAEPDPAGYGYRLVAKRDLPEGHAIHYVGKVISKKESKMLSDRYDKQVNHHDPDLVIAGEIYSPLNVNMGGFANDFDYYQSEEMGVGNRVVKKHAYRDVHTTRNNAVLKTGTVGAAVVLIDDVQAGEEIGVRYGGDYWKVQELV